jgi:hypothetical protein
MHLAVIDSLIHFTYFLTGGMVQMEYLVCKCDALSSNHSSTKKKIVYVCVYIHMYMKINIYILNR